jgi:hypothetical protein
MNNSSLIGMDCDMFLSDKNGHIGMFDSAGGFIPKWIEDEIDIHIELSKYLQSLSNISEELYVNPNLNTIVKLETTTAIERYLLYSNTVAKKGIFIFNKTDTDVFLSDKYHFTVRPNIFLQLENLPLKYSDAIPKILSVNFLEIENIKICTLKH